MPCNRQLHRRLHRRQPHRTRTDNPYYQGNRLRGNVVPEKQEGGYILVVPNQPERNPDEDAGYLDM